MALLEVPGQSCHVKILLAEAERDALQNTGLVEHMCAQGQVGQLAFKPAVAVDLAIATLLSKVSHEQKQRLQKRFGWGQYGEHVQGAETQETHRPARESGGVAVEAATQLDTHMAPTQKLTKDELVAKALALGIDVEWRLKKLTKEALQGAIHGEHAAVDATTQLDTHMAPTQKLTKQQLVAKALALDIDVEWRLKKLTKEALQAAVENKREKSAVASRERGSKRKTGWTEGLANKAQKRLEFAPAQRECEPSKENTEKDRMPPLEARVARVDFKRKRNLCQKRNETR